MSAFPTDGQRKRALLGVPPGQARLRSRRRRAAHGPDIRSTRRWRKVRSMVLAAHPLCADPFGIHARHGQAVEAVEVDHIIPYMVAPELALDLANLQGLCTACHGRKSGQERREGAGRGGGGASG
jgi:5-methylcytosine-specific restriction endonuclease McrA